MLSDNTSDSSVCYPSTGYGPAAVGEKQIDWQTRERIRAWVIHLRDEQFHGNAAEMARKMGFKQSSPVTQVASGTKTAGFDFVLRLHRSMGIQMNTLVDSFPTVESEKRAALESETRPPNPQKTSRATASPRRRKQQGG